MRYLIDGRRSKIIRETECQATSKIIRSHGKKSEHTFDKSIELITGCINHTSSGR